MWLEGAGGGSQARDRNRRPKTVADPFGGMVPQHCRGIASPVARQVSRTKIPVGSQKRAIGEGQGMSFN